MNTTYFIDFCPAPLPTVSCFSHMFYLRNKIPLEGRPILKLHQFAGETIPGLIVVYVSYPIRRNDAIFKTFLHPMIFD